MLKRCQQAKKIEGRDNDNEHEKEKSGIALYRFILSLDVANAHQISEQNQHALYVYSHSFSAHFRPFYIKQIKQKWEIAVFLAILAVSIRFRFQLTDFSY